MRTIPAPEGCMNCGFQPRSGYDCIAVQWQEQYGRPTHPGCCWNGKYPDNAGDLQTFLEDQERKKRREFEQRKREQAAVQLTIDEAA